MEKNSFGFKKSPDWQIQMIAGFALMAVGGWLSSISNSNDALSKIFSAAINIAGWILFLGSFVKLIKKKNLSRKQRKLDEESKK